MSRERGFYPPRPPRREATDGVRARSRRGEIGGEWWSRRFVDALEAICEPKRLRRGRSYARSGQVSDLLVDVGLATASVQGSRRQPYSVTIEIDPFDAQDWADVETAMTEQAIFLAALLAGVMPDDIESAFSSAGLALFPARPDELRTVCSCPDWENPCKHIAAALYILAERFDEDPFEIFRWRGCEKQDLIRRLRDRRATIADAAFEHGGHTSTASTDSARPLSAAVNDFWRLRSPVDAFPMVPRAASTPDAVLRELGPLPPTLEPGPSAERLAALYRRATIGAERIAYELE